jgi:ATP synthase protein I
MDDKRAWFKAARLSGVGIGLVASTFLGLFLGIFLDGKLGTRPLFTIMLLLLGITAGFINIFKEVRR